MMARVARARMGGATGQSTLEYVLIFIVIVAAVLALGNTLMRPAAETMLTDSANVVSKASDKLQTQLGL